MSILGLPKSCVHYTWKCYKRTLTNNQKYFLFFHANDDFAAEDMKERIRAMFVYIAANFRISNRIATKRMNIRNLEYESNIHSILIA